MKITKEKLKRTIQEELIAVLEGDVGTPVPGRHFGDAGPATGPDGRVAPMSPAIEQALALLEDIDDELMMMGGDTKGYRPRLDSPPLSHEQKYAMESANEMRTQIQKVISLLSQEGQTTFSSNDL